MSYKRVLLKISGELFGGKKGFGIDSDALEYFSSEIKQAISNNIQLALVIGGGNIYRGSESSKDDKIGKTQGDYMGMLSTVINAIALNEYLTKLEVKSKIINSLNIDKIGELFNQHKIENYLSKSNVLIFSGGTGNPYFTTDTAGALKAVEINADVLLKGTKVDGIYSEDPKKYPEATKYNTINYNEVIDKSLQVMDLTAITLCKENKLPVIVFDISKPGNLLKIIKGEKIGTLVS